jgi:Mn-dependent DtxR family transcriptional regulator
MDYASMGFIKAGKNRLRILETLSSGFATQAEISHRLRIPEPLVSKALKELGDREFAKVAAQKNQKGYVITEKGLRIFRQVRKG